MPCGFFATACLCLANTIPSANPVPSSTASHFSVERERGDSSSEPPPHPPNWSHQAPRISSSFFPLLKPRRKEHFHYSCVVDFVVSHPFHKEREMDGARTPLHQPEKCFSLSQLPLNPENVLRTPCDSCAEDLPSLAAYTTSCAALRQGQKIHLRSQAALSLFPRLRSRGSSPNPMFLESLTLSVVFFLVECSKHNQSATNIMQSKLHLFSSVDSIS
jgi:hypothetical protein